MGILIALLTTLLTSDFKVFMNVQPEIWNALFMFGSISIFVWFGFTLYRVIIVKIRCDKPNIDFLVEKIVKASC